MTPVSIAFFGLGALGAPLAQRLRAAGHRLAVSDPRDAAIEAHRRACGADTADPATAQAWITCVTDEGAADALYFGADGLVERMPPGTLAIDHTTTAPGFARRVADALARRGCGFVDSPLSGGVGGARAGALLAMLGGDAADCDRARPLLECYCTRIVGFGGPGCGQAAKLANQLAIAGTVRGLHEAARFARVAGLDVGRLFDALAAGSAHSAQMDQHAVALVAAAAPFARQFGWIAKDLEIARAELRAADADAGLAGWLLGELSGVEA